MKNIRSWKVIRCVLSSVSHAGFKNVTRKIILLLYRSGVSKHLFLRIFLHAVLRSVWLVDMSASVKRNCVFIERYNFIISFFLISTVPVVESYSIREQEDKWTTARGTESWNVSQWHRPWLLSFCIFLQRGKLWRTLSPGIIRAGVSWKYVGA